jgi:hypothetical protein
LVATLVIGEALIPATLRKLGESWQALRLGEKSKGEAGSRDATRETRIFSEMLGRVRRFTGMWLCA